MQKTLETSKVWSSHQMQVIVFTWWTCLLVFCNVIANICNHCCHHARLLFLIILCNHHQHQNQRTSEIWGTSLKIRRTSIRRPSLCQILPTDAWPKHASHFVSGRKKCVLIAKLSCVQKAEQSVWMVNCYLCQVQQRVMYNFVVN